jgi:CRISPR/Cas system-associated protein endoribonuclease Cas2
MRNGREMLCLNKRHIVETRRHFSRKLLQNGTFSGNKSRHQNHHERIRKITIKFSAMRSLAVTEKNRHFMKKETGGIGVGKIAPY